MAPGERRRQKSPVVTLPEELLLEIVARSEPSTFVRCAAACRSLRREILDPSFLRRVCTTNNNGGAGTIPPRVIVYLHYDTRKQDPPPLLVSLLHPATPAASSFTDGCLAPHVLRRAIDIRGSYEPLTSRGGLVVLIRRRQHDIGVGTERYDLCVFNPMTGDRTYLPCLSRLFPTRFVLLTAADGIGCSSFRLLAANVDRCTDTGGFRITVQATAGTGGWGPVTQDVLHGGLILFRHLNHQREPVVLHGGVVHWLLLDGDHVLTYDVRTEKLGTVMLPPTSTYDAGCRSRQLLGMSPDGRRLRLLGSERFMVSMWVHSSDDGCWVKEAVIDVEQKLQSVLLRPENVSLGLVSMEFKCCAERSGVVVLQVYHRSNRRLLHLILLDLETKEMRKINSPRDTSMWFEVDLSMRLQAMKIY